MGWEQRANPDATPEAKQRARNDALIRRVLEMFPDRATYEQWLEARQVPADVRAHFELFLPPQLRAVTEPERG